MNHEWYLWYLLACGLLAQLWIGLRVGKVLGRVMYATVAASSLLRFAWACAKVHGFRKRRFPVWLYAPGFWLNFFLIELGARPGDITHFGVHGQWKGIGRWSVHPKRDMERQP